MKLATLFGVIGLTLEVENNTYNSSYYSLDQNGAYTFTHFIEAPGRTKFQIFATIHYYLAMTFDEDCTIKLNDKDEGCIIALLSMDNIAVHSGGANKYAISIKPIFRADVKDGKCRVSCSLFDYKVTKIQGGGLIKFLNKDSATRQKFFVEHWPLKNTVPFGNKDLYGAKKTTQKAAEATVRFFKLMSDSIGDAIRNGIIGEDLNW